MSYTRREFGKLALAGLPAAAVLGRNESIFSAQAKPNSLINGVQIGTITYSYRSMPDQSAEATLKYVVDSGISGIELMGGPVESFAGAPTSGRGGGAGRGPGGPGGAGGPGGGGRAAAGIPSELPAGAKIGEWNGQKCVVPAPGGGRGAGADAAARGGGGRRGGGRAEMTPEEQATQQAAQQEAAAKLKAWRTSVSMDKFKQLRKMYNDAGVTIYAWKQLSPNMSDEEFEYIFNVAEALGCTHTTLELPAGENAEAQLKRIGDFAVKKKIYA